MRLPLIRPHELNAEQRPLYDEMLAGITAGFSAFRAVDDRGALIGPWNASLHHPEIGRTSWALTLAIARMGALPARPKEVAILVVGGFYKAAYEIYAHTAVAERLGIPTADISSLVANLKPEGLSPDEATAFEAAHSLCRGKPLPENLWGRATAAFGDVGAAQLVYLVGIYAFVSMFLNGFDMPVPQDA